MKDPKDIYVMLKEKKVDITVSAIICAAIGMIVILCPGQTISLLCRALALVLLIMGIADLLAYFVDRKSRHLGLASGAVLILIGIFIMVKPTVIIQLLVIVIGAVLVLHGLKDMQLVMEGKEYEEKRWWLPSLLATITLMFGLYLIWYQFQASTVCVWFLGSALLYDGLSDLIILRKVRNAKKVASQEEEVINEEFEGKEE